LSTVTATTLASHIGQKVLDAPEGGEDLLDVQTWKRIEKEEWDEWAGCGLDALKARGGAPLR
jgi:hypothetical protein